MKKLWKALGITALAALVPIRLQKDKETGKRKYQSLLISVDIGPDGEDGGVSVGINLGEGVLSDLGRKVVGASREAAMFTDDPAEATVDAEELQAVADDLQAAADEAQAAADELQAAADEAQAAADEADAADFDPEF